ncbi:MAG: hypothetical protein ACO22X_12420, partial [Algoriphagus sp.]
MNSRNFQNSNNLKHLPKRQITPITPFFKRGSGFDLVSMLFFPASFLGKRGSRDSDLGVRSSKFPSLPSKRYLLALLFLLGVSVSGLAQHLTISSSGQTGTSGTNWSTSGTNPVTITVTGTATIN